MKTKSKPSEQEYYPYSYFYSKTREETELTSVAPFSRGAETITYGDGGKIGGKWPWKPCWHDKQLSYTPGGRATFTRRSNGGWFAHGEWENLPGAVSPPGLPVVTFDDECIRQCLRQVDLNSSDAVLLYSGVIQAIPLLGGVLKFNKILKDVSKHVSKTLRKKPFTTVLKDLIQADFIDRFVISPTIADVRKFQDAVDYCLRVINTARERNEHAFAVSAENKTVLTESTTTFRNSGPLNGMGEILFTVTNQQYVESKAFMLVRAEYDMTAVSPLKLWAQRVGLTRPLDSVWDLVPFSFVVDYFTRAGDFISHLSDEMSQVDGLKGKILAIEDLWYTLKGVGSAKAVQTRWVERPWIGSGWYWVEEPKLSDVPSHWKRESFSRGQISAPWKAISSLETSLSDYLSVSIDLSSTRKRTLAELFIQAKL